MGKKNRKPTPPATAQPSTAAAPSAAVNVATVAPLPALPLDNEFGQSLVSWLMPAYILMIVLGMFAFRFGGAVRATNGMTHDRALFTAINAASLTGFQQTYDQDPNAFEPMGKRVIFLLVLGGSLFSQISGGLAVKRILGLRYSDWRILRAAVICEAAVILLGLIIPLDKLHHYPGSVSQALSAFGNCGTFVGHMRLTADGKSVMISLVHFVLLPLSVLGGLGLPVLIEFYDFLRRRIPFTRHAMTVFMMSGGLYLGGFFLLVLAGLAAAPQTFDFAGQMESLRHIFISSSAMAINSRTAGLPLQPLTDFSRPAQWLIMLLMIIGAAPAGTGGGLKSTTIYVIFRDVRKIFRGQAIDRTLSIALTWVGIYALIIVVCQCIFLSTMPGVMGDRTLFLAISAFSNVGLSHDPISTTGTALYVLSLTMLAGRMIPVMILWWMADTTRGPDVAVG